MSYEYENEIKFHYLSINISKSAISPYFTMLLRSKNEGLEVHLQLREGELFDMIDILERRLEGIEFDRHNEEAGYMYSWECDKDGTDYILTIGFPPAVTSIFIILNGDGEARKFLDEMKQLARTIGI